MRAVFIICSFVWIILFNTASFGKVIFEKTEMTISGKLEDKEAHFEFPYYNDSDKAVSISGIQTSCACTTAAASNAVCKPKSRGVLSAVVHISTQQGTVENHITVALDGQPAVKLTARLELPSILHFDPGPVAVWRKMGKTSAKIITVTSTDALPVRIAGASVNSQKVRVEVREIEYRKRYELLVWPTSTEKELNTAVQLSLEAEFPGPPKTSWIFVQVSSSGKASE